jgi:flagellar protein FlbD
VIVLHRLGHQTEPFHLNPDMILTVEATPDTVVTLTSGAKIVVGESPAHVAEEVRAWRTSVLADALQRRRDEPFELADLTPPPARVPLIAVAATPPVVRAAEDLPPPADHLG